jgi:hypothetical protein
MVIWGGGAFVRREQLPLFLSCLARIFIFFIFLPRPLCTQRQQHPSPTLSASYLQPTSFGSPLHCYLFLGPPPMYITLDLLLIFLLLFLLTR